MKLSTKTRYGLRILLQMAVDQKVKTAVKGKDIAKKQDISEPYLEQIMIPLKTSGIVKTIRGCHGGYKIDIPFEEISVCRIIELFEGPIRLVKCSEDNGSCKRLYKCQTSNVWSKLAEVIKKESSKVTIATLLEDIKKGASLEFVI